MYSIHEVVYAVSLAKVMHTLMLKGYMILVTIKLQFPYVALYFSCLESASGFRSLDEGFVRQVLGGICDVLGNFKSRSVVVAHISD